MSLLEHKAHCRTFCVDAPQYIFNLRLFAFEIFLTKFHCLCLLPAFSMSQFPERFFQNLRSFLTRKAAIMVDPFQDAIYPNVENKSEVLPNVGSLIKPTGRAFIDLGELPVGGKTCDFCHRAFSRSDRSNVYPVRLPVSQDFYIFHECNHRETLTSCLV